MKKIFSTMMLLAAMTTPVMTTQAWAAADYTFIPLTVDANVSADKAWAKISDFCFAPTVFGSKCMYSVGNGDIGTIRKLNGTTEELMVGKTRYSYTYTQPASTILYHGTLAAEPVDAIHCKLEFILFYDQSPLATPEAQAANRKQRGDRFLAALVKMKALVEAP